MGMDSGLSDSDAANEIMEFLNREIQPNNSPERQQQQSTPPIRKAAPTQENLRTAEDDGGSRADADEKPSGDSDATAAPASSDTEQTQDDAPIDSLEAIASYFEVEPDEVLANIEVEAPDGSRVPIGVALEQWREADALVGHRRAELEAAYEKRVEEANAAEERQLARLHAATKNMITILNEEYSDEIIARARHEDADRYVKLIDRRRQIVSEIERAVEQFEDHGKRREAASQADIQKLLAEENAKLLKARPEWADRKVRSQSLIAGQNLLRSFGFTQQEIDSVMDHRILLLVDLAVKGKRLSDAPQKKTVEELRKRGLKRPTVGPNGQPRRDTEGPTNQMKARAQQRAVLKKTGDVRDAARLIEDLI